MSAQPSKHDLAEFKSLLHSEMQEAALALLPRYFEMLQDTEDPEELRKGLDFFVRTVGAEAEKKQDPYGNLPIVQITFNNGQLQAAQTVPALGAIDVPEFDTLPVSSRLLGATAINADLDID